MDVKQMCRVCGQIGGGLNPLSVKHERIQLSVIVQVVCPIKIFDDDNLPQQICDHCKCSVINAQKLREKCIDTDQMFKRMLEKSTNYNQNKITENSDQANVNKADDSGNKRSYMAVTNSTVFTSTPLKMKVKEEEEEDGYEDFDSTSSNGNDEFLEFLESLDNTDETTAHSCDNNGENYTETKVAGSTTTSDLQHMKQCYVYLERLDDNKTGNVGTTENGQEDEITSIVTKVGECKNRSIEVRLTDVPSVDVENDEKVRESLRYQRLQHMRDLMKKVKMYVETRKLKPPNRNLRDGDNDIQPPSKTNKFCDVNDDSKVSKKKRWTCFHCGMVSECFLKKF